MTYRRVRMCGALAGLVFLAAVVGSPHAAGSAAVQVAAVETESAAAGAAARLDSTDAYRLALLRLKSHLSVARALLQLRAAGADYHLREPVRDIFHSIEGEIERRSAPFTADVLEQLEFATEGDPVTALATIELAVTAIVGSFAQTGGLDAESALALAQALLGEAVSKYAEAVIDNEVVDLRKYQSGRGFVTEAEALVRHSSGLKGEPGHDELLRSVVLIRQAWPGIMPPPIVFDPESVAGRLEEAVAAMDAMR